jgi:hypothetical protein
LKTFVCLSSVEVDQGDRLLSAGALNDVGTEPDDGLPPRSAEWRSMRASYFAQLLQFFFEMTRSRVKTLAIVMIATESEERR